MKNRLRKKILILATRKFFTALLVGSLVLGAGSIDLAAAVNTSFLYTLSNFSGPVPYNWASIFVDEARNEIYVVDPREGDVRIFDKNGMEVYRFGDDGGLGMVVGVVVKKDGSILVLSKRNLKSAIILCNYRGEPLSELELKNFPPKFSGFSPDRMAYREGRLYLLDSISMKIAVTETNGFFLKGYDVGSMLGGEEKKRVESVIDGFSVDREGNVLFTIPVFFSAYRLSPDGKVRSFGGRGSGPGGFGIVGGIVADDRGNYYVADRLKSVILIFDKDFRFQKEFGYRGMNPGNLIGPKSLVLDNLGRLYVSQLRSRGVSVFKINYH